MKRTKIPTLAILLLHNLPSATHPPFPSARRSFNAPAMLLFEMKTKTEPYFSILSSIILWTGLTVGWQTAQYRSTEMLTVMKMEADREMLDMGYSTLHRDMGYSTLHRDMELSTLHRDMGYSSLHSTLYIRPVKRHEVQHTIQHD